MSQARKPASPDLNPRRNRAPSPSPNESDAHLNPSTTLTPDNSDLSTAGVVGTHKRPREDDFVEVGTSADVPEAKRRVKATHDVIYRIVVPSRQIGKVIGRAGHRIQQIRDNTRATIKIADAISRHEERVIIISSKDSDNICSDAENALHQIVSLILKISGEIPAVLRAVVEIGCQLRDNPPKQVISITPPNNAGFRRQSQPYVDPTSANYVTLEIMVPENLVGGLIGRFGANISRIRNETGAIIKVYGGRGEQSQRQIHLGGTPQQIALAKQRVDEYVYAEMMRQAGGQLQPTAGQLQQYSSQLPMPDLSNALYQGYGHTPALYTTSNEDFGTMAAALPPMYASTATTQAPPCYAHKSYPAPPL